jgi:hypothetical protein
MHDLIPICDDETYKTVKRLVLEGAKSCLNCGARQTSLDMMSDCSVVKPQYCVACKECKHQGPFAKNIPKAIERWNKPLGFIAAILLNLHLMN